MANSAFNLNETASALQAFATFDGTQTPIVIRNQMNIASITDNGVGQYHPNFTTNLASANYTTLVTFRPASGNNAYFYAYCTIPGTVTPTTPTTSGFDMAINGVTSTIDSAYAMVAVFL